MEVEEIQKGTETNITKPDKPAILDFMLDNLEILHPDLKRETLLGMLLSKLSFTFCCARVQFQETDFGKLNFPNLYMAFYLRSGFGKNRATDCIDTIFEPLEKFNQRNEDAYKEKKESGIAEKIKKEHPDWDDAKCLTKASEALLKERRFAINSSSTGTPEGLYAKMSALKKRRTGAVPVFQSEFGTFVISKSERNEAFLAKLLDAYDCKCEGRDLVTESLETITGVPCCSQFLSSPDIVKQSPKFRLFQTTGLGRRIWTFMQDDDTLSLNLPTQKEKETALKNLQKASHELFNNIFPSIFAMNDKPAQKKEEQPTNVILKFDDGVYDNCYVPYEIENRKLYNATKNELIKLSILEYPFRILKVSCMFAVLNHHSNLVIKAEDFEQARKIVESTDGIRAFVTYAPVEKGKIDYITDGIIEDFEENEPVDGLYSKTRLRDIFEKSLKGNVSGARDLSRNMLNSDHYAETKSDLKVELQKRGYDLEEINAKSNTSTTTFDGIRIVKLTLPESATLTNAQETALQNELGFKG